MAVADNGDDAGKAGEFFWSALSVATCGDDADAGIEAVGAANERTGFAIGLGCNAAGVDDDYVGVGWRAFFETGGAQETGDCFAIGACGAATEILDVERRRHEFSLRLRAVSVREGDGLPSMQQRASQGWAPKFYCRVCKSEAQDLCKFIFDILKGHPADLDSPLIHVKSCH